PVLQLRGGPEMTPGGAPRPACNPLLDVLSNRSPFDWLAWVGNLTAFGARVLPAAVAAVVRPGWWVRPLYGMVVGALPLAAVTGVALGVVIWLHTRDVLARTGTG